MMQAHNQKLDPRTTITNAIGISNMPIKITWNDVKFSVNGPDQSVKKKPCGSIPNTDHQILKGCSGSAMPG